MFLPSIPLKQFQLQQSMNKFRGHSKIELLRLIIIHLLSWVCYFLINEIEPVIQGISSLVFHIWIFSYSILACIFYFIYFYLNPKFLSKNRYLEYVFSLIVLFFIYNTAREIQLKILHITYPYFTEIPSINLVPITYKGIMLRSFTYYFFHVPLFTCFFVWKNSREKDRLLLMQKQEVADLKAANIQSELSFLQSQINPHFLFNTLNSFYSKSVQLSADLAEGIETLSSIMRYAIQPYGPNKERSDTVSLMDEILHIDNVIKIYRLRYPDTMHLDFKVEGKIQNVHIIPFVLITLVENVFKHGDLNDHNNPAKLHLVKENGTLTFTTQNKVRVGIKEQGTSIGLANVLNRLRHTYGDKSNFESREENGIYFASLKIDLGNDCS